MPDRHAIEYAVLRLVPRVERQEFLNVGVVVFCKTLTFLEARVDRDLSRLVALHPQADLDEIRGELDALLRICRGGPGAGYFANLSQSERFNWLAAPSSTMLQASPVHGGMSDNPAETLDELFDLLVN